MRTIRTDRFRPIHRKNGSWFSARNRSTPSWEYPAWKAKTEAKFSDISRGIHESEFDQALAYAREAGLWRLDRRWRRVRPRFEFVDIPPAG